VDPDGDPEGEKLEDSDQLLWRQVRPEWCDDGLSYQGFKPGSRDGKRLSTSQSSLISARAAYERHTQEYGRPSGGTWAISVGEAEEATVPAYDDGGIGDLPEDHASLYFGKKSRSQIKSAAMRLAVFADERGCQYDPNS
jgi:hypothetical protein